MRVLDCTILTIGTMLAVAPAGAQTYDPSYPVCLQTYGIDGSYIDCSLRWRSAPRPRRAARRNA
jgi:hypothetical protein